jgi:signal transduction histidine kinase
MRKRIMLLVVGVTTVVLLAFVIPLALLVRHVVYQDAAKSVQDKANRIANYVRGSFPAPTTVQLEEFLGHLGGDSAASVQLPDGTVVGRQPPGDPADLPEVRTFRRDDPTSRRAGPLQSAVDFRGGKLAQLPILSDPQQPSIDIVRVFASDAQLHAGETRWWLLPAGSAVGLLLLAAVAAELLTRRLVRPLERTAETAHRISAGDVSARAPTDGPREIAEVGAALNQLGDRIDQLIAEERETVADLSHRLRTPLTALRLDAEALRDPVEADRVSTHVSSLERMLTAVIRTARRPQREGRMPSCDAAAVVAGRVAFWSALTEEQNRPATIELADSPLPVRASAEDLGAAVDALLENVIAHTPEGTAFDVRLAETARGARLEVSDAGPGLPAHALVRGRSDRGSTGLGLSIARRCAELSGGEMAVGSSPHGGARVILDLGAAR